jgi:hypothetical protein
VILAELGGCVTRNQFGRSWLEGGHRRQQQIVDALVCVCAYVAFPRFTQLLELDDEHVVEVRFAVPRRRVDLDDILDGVARGRIRRRLGFWTRRRLLDRRHIRPGLLRTVSVLDGGGEVFGNRWDDSVFRVRFHLGWPAAEQLRSAVMHSEAGDSLVGLLLLTFPGREVRFAAGLLHLVEEVIPLFQGARFLRDDGHVVEGEIIINRLLVVGHGRPRVGQFRPLLSATRAPGVKPVSSDEAG